MENFMTTETFKQILAEQSMVFTNIELQDMIDEELGKDPEEMDTHLIEMCLTALNI